MKTHIEISARNLVHNLKLFKEHTGKKIMLVVKANAYGHGLREVVQIAKGLDFVDYYAVDCLEEALAVNKIDDRKKILVLGWADREELREMILKGFETIVPSLDYFRKVDQVSRELRVRARCQLKVETGTSRLGMVPGEVLEIMNNSNHDYIDIIGIYSHFANIEDTTDHSYAQHQLRIFNNLLEQVRANRVLKHFSCSASALLFPETYFDIVRIGISAYGFWPSRQTYISYIEKNKKRIELKPVLSWYAKVSQVKHLKLGEYIGYGLTYRTFSESKIVVVPVGYYDGYDRKLSNMSNIIVKGVRAPVRGRVCMNMLMAEVTHILEVREGDPVILLGENGEERIDADDLAELIGTINYEVVSRINPLIPRRIVDK